MTIRDFGTGGGRRSRDRRREMEGLQGSKPRGSKGDRAREDTRTERDTRTYESGESWHFP